MPWNSNTKKITGSVGISDIKSAVNGGSNDIGGLIVAACNNGQINKWAKWKPLKSTSPIMTTPILHMGTDEQRRNAGRASQYDTGLVYGVRGGVAYTADSILDMHNRSFVYEGPSGASGEVYRFSDFVCPEDISPSHAYGYYKDAKCNLNGVAYKWRHDIERIYVGSYGALFVNLSYSTRANNNEEINIEDFFHSSVTVPNCYPCILITTATGYSYIHCLYPDNSTTLTTLGNNPQGMRDASWRLDLSDSNTVPAVLQQSGVYWTWSVFLASSRYLVGYNSWDISTWVTVKEPGSPDPGDVFQSDLIGIPDLVGLTWQAAANDLPYFFIDSIIANQAGNGFIVAGHFGSDYVRPDASENITITINALLYDPEDINFERILGSASHNIIFAHDPSHQVARFTEFLFFDDFDLAYPGRAETYTVRSNADVSYKAMTPTSSPYTAYNITYSAQ